MKPEHLHQSVNATDKLPVCPGKTGSLVTETETKAAKEQLLKNQKEKQDIY